MSVEAEIREMVEREIRAMAEKNVDLLLSVYHPDLVWAWPPHGRAYDPMEWILRMGRFEEERWKKKIGLFFHTHTIIHDRRDIRKIVVSDEQDGAFAVIDQDTKWHQSGDDSPWHEGTGELHVVGRACKIYTLMNDGWKLYYHPGTMTYPVEAQAPDSEGVSPSPQS